MRRCGVLAPAGMLCNFIGLLPHTVNLFETVYPHKCIEKEITSETSNTERLIKPLHYVIFYVSYFEKIFRICSYRPNLYKLFKSQPVSGSIWERGCKNSNITSKSRGESKVDFKRNESGRKRIYEYAPPQLKSI